MPSYFVHVLIVCTAICMLASCVTGFLTCVLAVTRTISLVRPLHIVKFRSIAFGMIVYGMILLVMVPAYIVCDFEILKGWRHEFIMVSVSRSIITAMLLVIFIVVITSNVASMVTIYLSQSTTSVCEKAEKKTEKKTEKRRATVIVGILSVCYCICNIGFLVDLILKTGISENHVPEWLRLVNFHVLMTLNSACNPVVYFVRKAEMRIYLRDEWRRISSRGV